MHRYSLTLTDSNHLAGVETISSSTYVTYNRSKHPIEMEYHNAKSSDAGHINLVNGVLRNNTEISGISGITVNFTGTLKLLLSTDKETWPVSFELTSGVDPMSLSLDTFNYFLLRGDADISSINISYTCDDETYELDANLIVNHLDSVGYPILASTVNKGTTNVNYNFATPTIDGLMANHPSIQGVYEDELFVRNVYYNEYDTFTSSTVASTDFVEEDGYYYIDSASDFLAFANLIANDSNKLEAFKGKTVKMRKSINWANNVYNHIGSQNYGKSVANCVVKFAGTFDGGNNIFANITYNNTGTLYYGFFSALNGATIKNFTLSGDITAKDRSGSLAYTAQGTNTIDNYHYYGNMHDAAGNGFFGGIIGSSLGTTNVINSGYYGTFTTVNSVNYIGGLVGFTQAAGTTNISNSRAHIESTSVANNFGFIHGYIGPTSGSGALTLNIDNCISSGSAICTAADNTLGGAVAGMVGLIVGNNGSVATTKITNSRNYADLTGNHCVGGIAGAIYQNNEGYGSDTRAKFVNLQIDNCENYADISAKKFSGGLVGRALFQTAKSYINNSTNFGNVTGSGSSIAGIAGYGPKSVVNYCKNYGTISGTGDVAGIVGTGSKSVVTGSINYGDVTGTSGATAGLVATHNENAQLYGGGNLGNITNTANANTGGLVGYNGINSIIDFDNMIVGGTVTSKNGANDLVAGTSNNVIIHKHVNGVIVDYDFLIPGNAYTPTSHRLTDYEDLSEWYTDSSMTMAYENETVLGVASTNSNNLRLHIYASATPKAASPYSGRFYNNLEVEFPTLQHFGLVNPEFQSVDPTLYNFQMWTTNEGIMIYNEQNVTNFVTENGNKWKNTHCEFEIWNNDFGYGWGGTYLALFTDGTYYLNNETNLKGFYYYVEYEQIEDITHIEYYAIIEFDNNTTNDAESYAYIKPYQFMPEEYHEGLNSINHWRDDRYLITGTEKSFQVHETIDAFMLT